MISVTEAKQILQNKHIDLPHVILPLNDALNYATAEDILSPINLPPFDQSAMDGYAVRVDNVPDAVTISLVLHQEIQAGDAPIISMKNNTAIRIFTGAPVPKNATCVVVQEQIVLVNDKIEFSAYLLKPNANIRYQSSVLKASHVALPKNSLLNSAAIGLLASLGITDVNVIAKPIIRMIATGNELTQPGKTLEDGKIYESNTIMLSAALLQSGFSLAKLKYVKDEIHALNLALRKQLKKADILIISGGISVGKYDLVHEALLELGVEELFYKIAQKPGKPIFVGHFKNKIVFALPGNPASILVCFYEYVLPFLKQISGQNNHTSNTIWLPTQVDLQPKEDRALFLKASINGTKLELLEGQDSNILTSFAKADALVYLPPGKDIIPKESLVEVHLLPKN